MGKELAGWSHSKSCGQRLNVQVETSNEQCSSGVGIGTGALLTSLSVTWTVGSSAPSACLPMTPSCVVLSTCWREGMPSRGDFDRLERCAHVKLMNFNRVYTWVGEILSTNTGWMENELRAAPRGRSCGCWLTRSSTRAGNVRLQPRKPKSHPVTCTYLGPLLDSAAELGQAPGPQGTPGKWAVLQRDSSAQEQLLCTAQQGWGL